MAAISVHAEDAVPVSETNASLTDRVSRLLSARVRRLERERDELTKKIADSPPLSRRTQAGPLGFHSTPADSADESRTLSLTFDRPQDLTTIALVPARVDSTIHADEDYGFPRRFRIEVSDDGRSFETVADETSTCPEICERIGPAVIVQYASDVCILLVASLDCQPVSHGPIQNDSRAVSRV